MHTKVRVIHSFVRCFEMTLKQMMIALFKDKDSSSSTEETENGVDRSIAGWAYVGSHNFSPSAWGTLSGSALTPVLNVMMLFFITFSLMTFAQVTNFELGVVFPLRSEKEANDIGCWERPAKKYDLKSDVPWVGPDSIFHRRFTAIYTYGSDARRGFGATKKGNARRGRLTCNSTTIDDAIVWNCTISLRGFNIPITQGDSLGRHRKKRINTISHSMV